MTTVAAITQPEPREFSTIGFGNLLRSEWTKLRSVRSTPISISVALVATIGIAALVCTHDAHHIKNGSLDPQGYDGTLESLSGIYLAQVVIGALGVLTITSEYATGMIRATLTAVPQRRAMLAAKGLVFAAVIFAFGEVASVAAFWIGQSILHSAHAGASLGQPGVLRAVIGGGLYLTAVAMLGFGLGALIRHTAGALSAFFGLLFATSAFVDLLPSSWHDTVLKYMPANAGSQIITVIKSGRALSAWAGYGVLCLYAATAIAVALVAISRRDA